MSLAANDPANIGLKAAHAVWVVVIGEESDGGES